MIYTHVLNRGGKGVRSPADGIVVTRRPCVPNRAMQVGHNGTMQVSSFRWVIRMADIDKSLDFRDYRHRFGKFSIREKLVSILNS